MKDNLALFFFILFLISYSYFVQNKTFYKALLNSVKIQGTKEKMTDLQVATAISHIHTLQNKLKPNVYFT